MGSLTAGSTLSRLSPLLLGAGLALMSVSTLGLDIDRLWLPKAYRVHYLPLRDAALVVEAMESCDQVLRGTLDLDLSSQEAPVYRILCRRPDGTTYSELVDGSDMQPRSRKRPEPPPEPAAEREARLAKEAAEAERDRLAAEQAAAAAAEEEARRAEKLARRRAWEEQQRKQVLGEVCQAEILARSAGMINLTWITERPIAEELDNGQMRYHAEFDAENPWGQRLQYKAVCTISTPAELVVVVSARQRSTD